MPTPGISPATPTYRDRATAVLNPWWEAQFPRPTQNYMGAVKVLERALRAGWPEGALREALDEIPTISGGCLQYWWNRNKKQRPARLTPARQARLAAIEHDAHLVLSGALDYNEVGPDVRALVDSKLGQVKYHDAIEAKAS